MLVLIVNLSTIGALGPCAGSVHCIQGIWSRSIPSCTPTHVPPKLYTLHLHSGVGKTFWLGGGAQFETTHRVVSDLYSNLWKLGGRGGTCPQCPPPSSYAYVVAGQDVMFIWIGNVPLSNIGLHVAVPRLADVLIRTHVAVSTIVLNCISHWLCAGHVRLEYCVVVYTMNTARD